MAAVVWSQTLKKMVHLQVYQTADGTQVGDCSEHVAFDFVLL